MSKQDFGRVRRLRGRRIECSDEHREKQKGLRKSGCAEPNSNCDSDEQPWKQASPTARTSGGRLNESREAQFENARRRITSRREPRAKVTEARLGHLAKQLSERSVTEAGIQSERRDEHPAKAESPIERIVELASK
jgi:hypothetical protein